MQRHSSAETAANVLVVFGTRPEAIKLAPVIVALQADQRTRCKICVTGQHREMLDQVLEVFGITPDKDLNLMMSNQSLAGLTARLVTSLDEYFQSEQPDLVLVQGDTTTVFCATLAAFYRGIPVAHVEAGLRTGDIYAPWPEEANRVLTSRLARLHFAPTVGSRNNLLREGVPADRVFVTGNSVIDALFSALRKAKSDPPAIPGLDQQLLARPESPLVLITGHRRENFGEGFRNICVAIARLAQRFPLTQFVYPVHLNPNVRGPVGDALAANQRSNNVHLIDPVPYLPFVALLDRSTIILTDSGGIQEEAPSLGKPVLVMRDVTERPEAVEAGTVQLVGTDPDRIVRGVSQLLTDNSAYQAMARAHNPYGDGQASARIVEHCCGFLAEQMATAQTRVA